MGNIPMNKTMLLDKYPVFAGEIAKSETDCRNVDDVMAHLKDKVQAHPVAAYVGEFDHYGHVAAQAEGKIADDILALKYILFCVANALPNAMIGMPPYTRTILQFALVLVSLAVSIPLWADIPAPS